VDLNGIRASVSGIDPFQLKEVQDLEAAVVQLRHCLLQLLDHLQEHEAASVQEFCKRHQMPEGAMRT